LKEVRVVARRDGLGRRDFEKVLSDYNSCEQAGSSAGDDFRPVLVVDGVDTDRKEPAPTEGETCTSNRIACEIASSLPVDELGHPQERELRALMTASLDGDAATYHTLLTKLTGHLRAYYRHRFARIGHGPTEAEDLLQEVLIAVHTHRHTYDRLQPFTPWIHAIARYKFLDYLRRTKSSYKDLPITSAEELTAMSDMAAVESGLDLQRLMLKISSKARQVIQYVKLEGLSVSEAAVRCGMSESAVKVTVHRGLKALALQIRKESEA
jgi:RNA polymerase sigma-70 factor, ECF subfamily